MKTETRQQLDNLAAETARLNGVSDVSKKFSLVPEVEQLLVEKQTESVDFLGKINVVAVEGMTGQKVGLGMGEPLASRTDTQVEERETTDLSTLDATGYQCVQTNFDSHINYAKLDAWARAGNLPAMYRRAVVKRMALDRIMTAWHGKHAAKTTNRTQFPLLQDVNVGWLEAVRKERPTQIMGYSSDGAPDGEAYRLGEGGNWRNLDALVFDLASTLLDPWFVGGDDLVVLLGRELWVYHGLKQYDTNILAGDKDKLVTWMATQTVGGLPALMPPFLPDRAVVVTSLDNLSLYYQFGAVRRAMIDNPRKDRVEEYMSSNDAYVVEDMGKFASLRPEALKLKNEAGEWY